MASKHQTDLILCRKLPGVAVAKVCDLFVLDALFLTAVQFTGVQRTVVGDGDQFGLGFVKAAGGLPEDLGIGAFGIHTAIIGNIQHDLEVVTLPEHVDQRERTAPRP